MDGPAAPSPHGTAGPPASIPRDDQPGWMRSRNRIFQILNAYGLERDERLEFASTFLDRNITSFNDLDPTEVVRLRDACEGAALLAAHLWQSRQHHRR